VRHEVKQPGEGARDGGRVETRGGGRDGARARGAGRSGGAGQAGFSLVELIVAMGLTLMVMTMATTMIVALFNTRTRENRRSDTLADAQRALDLLSREIANAGFGLTDNGIVGLDSNAQSIRIRANLNANAVASDPDEDVKYALFANANGSYLVRRDLNGTTSMIAPVDGLNIRYFRERVTYTATVNNCNISNAAPATVGTPAVANEVAATTAAARYVVISMCVRLPAVGTVGGSGYQPPTTMQLVSDVTLRNGDLLKY
jgi:Tfp pilus assembly protein PilW